MIELAEALAVGLGGGHGAQHGNGAVDGSPSKHARAWCDAFA
jgi:hypothetical protein